jgi:hypothetical protein
MKWILPRGELSKRPRPGFAQASFPNPGTGGGRSLPTRLRVNDHGSAFAARPPRDGPCGSRTESVGWPRSQTGGEPRYNVDKKQHWKAKRKNGKVQVENGNTVLMAAVMDLFPRDLKPNTYVDVARAGSIRIPLYAEERPFGNAYRMLVTGADCERGKEPWLDLEKIPDVIKALREAEKKYKKAKRHLEGGVVRRVFRILF